MKNLKLLSTSSQIFIVLIFVYTALTLLLPANTIAKAELNVNDAQYYLLLLIVRLPIIAVWCLGFYAYRRLVNYTTLIKATPEGIHFATITKGVAWIVWGLVIPALLATVLNTIGNTYNSFIHIALIITNYTYVFVTLFAFSHISAGAHRFAKQSKIQPTILQIRLMTAGMVLIGVIYCYLISRQLATTGLTNSYNAFYLPNGFIWLTIVVPYLYAWFLGIFAAIEIILVAQKSPGIIYQRALRSVAIGLVIIIMSLFAMHYYRAILPRTGHLTLGVTLFMSYVTYATSAAGSVILAIGAKKLKQIEEL